METGLLLVSVGRKDGYLNQLISVRSGICCNYSHAG